MMKFVECPVVDSVPRLSLVLYVGLAYIFAGVASSVFRHGCRLMIGIELYRTFGRDSHIAIKSSSHRAPSMNRPLK